MAKKVKIKSKKPQGIGSKIFDVVNYLLLGNSRIHYVLPDVLCIYCVYQFFSVYQSGTGNTVPQRNQFRCLQGGIRESENLERL